MILFFNTTSMVVEFMYGFHNNNLGLILNACHMLLNCVALTINIYAYHVSKLKTNSKFNYGYGRFEIIFSMQMKSFFF
jgi:Co/Zn/Cd efflux system component